MLAAADCQYLFEISVALQTFNHPILKQRLHTRLLSQVPYLARGRLSLNRSADLIIVHQQFVQSETAPVAGFLTLYAAICPPHPDL